MVPLPLGGGRGESPKDLAGSEGRALTPRRGGKKPGADAFFKSWGVSGGS